MSRKALTDTKYELIKAHVLDPDSSPLSEYQQIMLERIISVSKILDKNPVAKQAVSLHMIKFKGLSRSQAYEDVRLAVKLFNTLHSFDYDFWQTWLINDIIQNITDCRKDGSPAAMKVIEMAHANLIKALGEKPKDLEDPKRLEKNSFYILIQNNTTDKTVFDIDNLHKLPQATLRELNRAIFTGNEMTEDAAAEIMGT